MAQNTDDGEGHASEVAESVSHEYFGRELVMVKEGHGYKEEGDHEGEGEDVVLYYGLGYFQIDFLLIEY